MSDADRLLSGMQQIEELIQRLDAVADPVVRDATVELVQLVMDLHGRALERVLSIVEQTGAAGSDIINRFSRDDLVSRLLMLHSLHPIDLETRVGKALEEVRPFLKSHGGNVELLGIEEGVVRLRLEGNCRGCPSSAATLKLSIERAIYEAAPDVAGLEVTGVVEQTPRPPSGFVPLEIVQVGLAAN